MVPAPSGDTLVTRFGHAVATDSCYKGTVEALESSQRLKTMASTERSKGMGQTALLAPEEAHIRDGEVSQAAGMDDYLAKTVTPERRAAVAEWWSKGRGCEDRVADEPDALDAQVLAALQELEQMSQAGLLTRLITLFLQE